MVTEEEMTVWIQSVWSCETVKDQIVDEAHGKVHRNTVLRVVLIFFHTS